MDTSSKQGEQSKNFEFRTSDIHDDSLTYDEHREKLAELRGQARRKQASTNEKESATRSVDAPQNNEELSSSEFTLHESDSEPSQALKDSSEVDGNDGNDGNTPSQKDLLVQIGAEQELFSDSHGDAYARVQHKDHLKTLKVDRSQFEKWLRYEFFRRHGKAPSSNTLTDALRVLEAKALYEGSTRQLANRFAWRDGTLWYDLADERWRAVEIYPCGWEIVENPPPLFRRYSHQKAQVEPVPTEPSRLRELLEPFLNTTKEADTELLLVWLVTAFLPQIPRTILIPWGPQGSAKSFLTRALRRLIDPSEIPMPRHPGGEAQMAQLLSHHAACFFDNLSELSQAESDTLCRAVTGDGFSKRKLYTDDEDVLYRFKRVLVLNGINIPSQRPDLLDRSLLIKLQHIPPEERRAEQELWREFESRRPEIVGAIVGALADAMSIEQHMSVKATPRMADWTRWGGAVAQALEIGAERFIQAYRANQREQNEEALDSHPVGAAVRELVKDVSPWEGSPEMLLNDLEKKAKDRPIDTRSKLWPDSASWLTRRLNEVEVNLRKVGIKIERGRGEERWIRLTRLECDTSNLITTKNTDNAVDGDGTSVDLSEQTNSESVAHTDGEMSNERESEGMPASPQKSVTSIPPVEELPF